MNTKKIKMLLAHFAITGELTQLSTQAEEEIVNSQFVAFMPDMDGKPDVVSPNGDQWVTTDETMEVIKETPLWKMHAFLTAFGFGRRPKSKFGPTGRLVLEYGHPDRAIRSGSLALDPDGRVRVYIKGQQKENDIKGQHRNNEDINNDPNHVMVGVKSKAQRELFKQMHLHYDPNNDGGVKHYLYNNAFKTPKLSDTLDDDFQVSFVETYTDERNEQFGLAVRSGVMKYEDLRYALFSPSGEFGYGMIWDIADRAERIGKGRVAKSWRRYEAKLKTIWEDEQKERESLVNPSEEVKGLATGLTHDQRVRMSRFTTHRPNSAITRGPQHTVESSLVRKGLLAVKGKGDRRSYTVTSKGRMVKNYMESRTKWSKHELLERSWLKGEPYGNFTLRRYAAQFRPFDMINDGPENFVDSAPHRDFPNGTVYTSRLMDLPDLQKSQFVRLLAPWEVEKEGEMMATALADKEPDYVSDWVDEPGDAAFLIEEWIKKYKLYATVADLTPSFHKKIKRIHEVKRKRKASNQRKADRSAAKNKAQLERSLELRQRARSLSADAQWLAAQVYAKHPKGYTLTTTPEIEPVFLLLEEEGFVEWDDSGPGQVVLTVTPDVGSYVAIFRDMEIKGSGLLSNDNKDQVKVALALAEGEKAQRQRKMLLKAMKMGGMAAYKRLKSKFESQNAQEVKTGPKAPAYEDDPEVVRLFTRGRNRWAEIGNEYIESFKPNYNNAFVEWFNEKAGNPSWFNNQIRVEVARLGGILGSVEDEPWSNAMASAKGRHALRYISEMKPGAFETLAEIINTSPEPENGLLGILSLSVEGLLAQSALALAGGDSKAAKGLYGAAVGVYGPMLRNAGWEQSWSRPKLKEALDLMESNGFSHTRYERLAEWSAWMRYGKVQDQQVGVASNGKMVCLMEVGLDDLEAEELSKRIIKSLPLSDQAEVMHWIQNRKDQRYDFGRGREQLGYLGALYPNKTSTAARFWFIDKGAPTTVLVDALGEVSIAQDGFAGLLSKVEEMESKATQAQFKVHAALMDVVEKRPTKPLDRSVTSADMQRHFDGSYSVAWRTVRGEDQSARALTEEGAIVNFKRGVESQKRAHIESMRERLDQPKDFTNADLQRLVADAIMEAPEPREVDFKGKRYTVVGNAAGVRVKRGNWTVVGWLNNSPQDLSAGTLSGTKDGLRGYIEFANKLYDGSNAPFVSKWLVRLDDVAGTPGSPPKYSIVESAIEDVRFRSVAQYIESKEFENLGAYGLSTKPAILDLAALQKLHKRFKSVNNSGFPLVKGGEFFWTDAYVFVTGSTSVGDGFYWSEGPNAQHYKNSLNSISGRVEEFEVDARSNAAEMIDTKRLKALCGLLYKSRWQKNRLIAIRFTPNGIEAFVRGGGTSPSNTLKISGPTRVGHQVVTVYLDSRFILPLLRMTSGALMGAPADPSKPVFIKMDGGIRAFVAPALSM